MDEIYFHYYPEEDGSQQEDDTETEMWYVASFFI